MVPESTQSHCSAKSHGSNLATASLILAIVSLPLTILCFIGVLTAILAITLGHFSLHYVRYSANPLPTKNKAIAGLVISYLYLGFVIVLVAYVIANRISETQFWDDTGMKFTIQTPLKGTSYEWKIKHRAPLVVVMAPREVKVLAQLDVAIPFVPRNPQNFQYLSINMIPKKYDRNILEVARQLVSGTRVYDKNYSAEDPVLITISGIQSVFFRNSLVINGYKVKGIDFLIPCTHGYYVLTFRCDPNSYDESFYKSVACTFKPNDK